MCFWPGGVVCCFCCLFLGYMSCWFSMLCWLCLIMLCVVICLLGWVVNLFVLFVVCCFGVCCCILLRLVFGSVSCGG